MFIDKKITVNFMNLEQYSQKYSGEIAIIEYDINMLENIHRGEYLEHLWKKYRSSETPVLIKLPHLEINTWKQVRMTKIFFTCDTEGVNLEEELRIILAPKPNFLERLQIRLHNIFTNKEKFTSLKSNYKIELITDLSFV